LSVDARIQKRNSLANVFVYVIVLTNKHGHGTQYARRTFEATDIVPPMYFRLSARRSY
jgi:hypothetical protein